jgi:hypothetical protein
MCYNKFLYIDRSFYLFCVTIIQLFMSRQKICNILLCGHKWVDKVLHNIL